MTIRKKSICILMAIITFISVAGCAAKRPTSQNEVGSSTNSGNDVERPGVLYDESQCGKTYEKEIILLPKIKRTVQQTVTGENIFIYGLDREEKNIFYLIQKSDLSVKELNIEENDMIACICASSDGSLPILTINEKGEYVLKLYNDEILIRSIVLPFLEEYKESYIAELTVTENGYIVFTSVDVLILNLNGELVERIGSYQREAFCIINHDSTVLIARTVSDNKDPNALVTYFDVLDTNLSKAAFYTYDAEFKGIYRDNGKNTVLVYLVNTIVRLDYTNGTKEALIDAFSSGIGSSELISLGENKYLSLGLDNVNLWYPSDTKSVVTLTLATYNINAPLSMLIQQYNKISGEYKIRIVDYALYDEEGQSNGMNRLKTDIIAGYTPDIFDLSCLPAETYAAKGLLEDLTPWFSTDSPVAISDFSPNVVEALTIDDGMFYVCPSFCVLTFCGDMSFVGKEEHWTPDVFFASLKDISPVNVFGPEMTKEKFLSYLLLFQGGEYFDKENQKCNFIGSSFQQFLEFAAQLPTEYNIDEIDSQSYGRAYVGEQSILTQWIGAMPGLNITRDDAIFSGDAQFVGFPSSYSTGMALVPSALIGVSSSSQDKEAAMDFIYFLLSDICQTSYVPDFPVIEHCLENQIEYWTEKQKTISSDFYTFYDNAEIKIEGETPGDRETKLVYEMISKANLLAKFDDTLFNIVMSECNLYFNRLISSEQAVKNVQSKVQVYLSEQYG